MEEPLEVPQTDRMNSNEEIKAILNEAVQYGSNTTTEELPVALTTKQSMYRETREETQPDMEPEDLVNNKDKKKCWKQLSVPFQVASQSTGVMQVDFDLLAAQEPEKEEDDVCFKLQCSRYCFGICWLIFAAFFFLFAVLPAIDKYGSIKSQVMTSTKRSNLNLQMTDQLFPVYLVSTI